MVRKILMTVRLFFSHSRKEKSCMVVEETDTTIRITKAYISETEKTIRVIYSLEVPSIKDFSRPFFLADYLIFVTTKGNLVTTTQRTVHILRANEVRPLDENECEELIFHGVSKYLHEYRMYAAKKMNISNTNVLLSNIFVSGMTIDGRAIIHPSEVSGKQFSIQLQGTFISREKEEEISLLKTWAREIFVFEFEAILAMFISGKNDVALFCKEESTSVFYAHIDRAEYAGDITWNISSMIHDIEDLLGVDALSARALFEKYTQGEASSSSSKIFDKIFIRHIKTLLRVIKTSQKQTKKLPVFHLICSFPIPKYIHWPKMLKGFKINSLEEYFSKKGFSEQGAATQQLSIQTKIFLTYPFIFPKNTLGNKLLLRRTPWIQRNTE